MFFYADGKELSEQKDLYTLIYRNSALPSGRVFLCDKRDISAESNSFKGELRANGNVLRVQSSVQGGIREKGENMSTRLAVISIIVENPDAVEMVNKLLHDASEYIIGRMGVPYRQKGISLISVALDAPQDVISALSGSIGRLKGISSKTAYSNIVTECED